MKNVIQCSVCSRIFYSTSFFCEQAVDCSSAVVGDKIECYYGSIFDSNLYLVDSFVPLKQGQRVCDFCIQEMINRKIIKQIK